MLGWLKDIAMFLVISGLILEVIAETKYERFVRWVVGIILILQLVRPMAETKEIWGRFAAYLQSFDYAVGSEKVLEEIYSVSDEAQQTVLKSYKESVYAQINQLLSRYKVKLLSAQIEVAEDGELLYLKVYAGYDTGKNEEMSGEIKIPMVAPVIVEREEEEEKIATPMELHIRSVLAEFYQIDENRIEVELKEASG